MTEHDGYLRYLALTGLHDRIGEDEVTDKQVERINEELHVIQEAQFASYFLIVWDLMKFCKKAGIPVGPGRGSVCGSFVCYLLGITDVDPLVWDIPFERFLHLERISMPDIDLDLCKDRRGEVIDYIKDKYGTDSVAQIITYGTIQAKGAVKRAYKDLEVEKTITGRFSQTMASELSDLIPDGSGADQVHLADWVHTDDDEAVTFKAAVAQVGIDYAEACDHDVGPDFLLNTILYLEGRRAHGSVHSAGVVIGSGPLMGLGIPLGRRNKDADLHCEHDMQGAEEVGLLKLDVLGLRTMTVIGEVETMVREDDPDFDIKKVPLDDAEVYKLLGGGPERLKGVFQLSKDSIGNALKGIHPSEFEDIIAILALYRPGPMEQLDSYAKRKLGKEEVEVAHPDLTPILSRTYGLIVYQEQVMAIAQVMGGYTPGEGDVFRKAIGKKIQSLIEEELAKFKTRALERGYTEEVLDPLCAQIADFGRYGFNRGHATGYAFITYWTAYLKCHYPVQFYTAVLNSHVGDADKIIQFSRDAARQGIRILTPDINTSGLRFKPEDGDCIRFGFEGVKGLGLAAASDIVEYRDSDECMIHTRKTVERSKMVDDKEKIYKASIKISERGPNPDRRPYEGFADLCKRHPGVTITAKKALIAAGAFDQGDLDERAILYVTSQDINTQSKKKRPKPIELDPDEDLPDEMDMIELEREVLGSYVTKHPLEPHRRILGWMNVVPIDREFGKIKTGASLKFAGVVTSIRLHTDKKNNQMAWLTLESDLMGVPEVMIFASLWERLSIADGDLVVIQAEKTYHEKFKVGLQATKVTMVDPTRVSAKKIRLNIKESDLMDVLYLKQSFVKRGAELSVMVDVGDGRLALIKTGGFIQTTIRALEEFEDEGWEVTLNPDNNDKFDGKRIEKAQSIRQDCVADYQNIWDYPDAKLWADHLGGNVVAEYQLRT